MARTHTFRTLTPREVDYGAHPLLISKHLGHSSIKITMDRYGHLGL